MGPLPGQTAHGATLGPPPSSPHATVLGASNPGARDQWSPARTAGTLHVELFSYAYLKRSTD